MGDDLGGDAGSSESAASSRNAVEPGVPAAGNSGPANALDRTVPSEAGGAAPVRVAAAADFPAPHWDKYEFVEVLGRGGMGMVYKATDRRLGRPVALKFIHGDDRGLIQRFLQEARAQARLDHPNICKVYEVGTVDGKPYIAMELVVGQTLDRACALLTMTEKLQILKDAAEAAHAAHTLGVIHRDLKPSNIMVERRPDGRLRPVLMDFGLARESGAAQGLTESGAVMGTPAYMSPEQARGDARHLDCRSDVYSLGATLYDALCGAPPFVDHTVVNILIKVLNDPPPPLRSRAPGAPEAVERIVGKCLNKEPAQRYQTAQALADDLGRYLSAQRITARRLSYAYRLGYWIRRNKSTALVAAALTLSLLTLTGYAIRTRLVTLRKDQQAKREAELARWLGQSVKDLEWVARTAYLLPLHDTAYEQRLVRERMAEIGAELPDSSEAGRRSRAYALGRGHLALHEWKQAREELTRAEQLGYKDPELDYALGRTLGALYSQALLDARTSGDRSFFEKRKQELDAELLRPTLGYLGRSRSVKSVSARYVEGLVAYYQQQYDAALAAAEEAQQQAPWLYEAVQLGGDVLLARALSLRDHGDHDVAEQSFNAAVTRYQQAAEIGRSDHLVYEALAEAWLRFGEQDSLRGRNPEAKLQQSLAAADRALVAAPAQSHGYTKKAYAYYFQGNYARQHGAPEEAIRLRELQVAAGRRATAQHADDAYAHESVGIAYLRLAEAFQEKKKPIQQFINEAYKSFESAVRINPRFPWAYNDHAMTLLVVAQDHSQKNQNPIEIILKAVELAKRAVAIDDQYMYAYNTISLASNRAAVWMAEHGQDPASMTANSERAARTALQINKNYLTAFWSLGDLYMINTYYGLFAGADIDSSSKSALAAYQSLLAIDPKMTDPYGYLAVVYYFQSLHRIASGNDPADPIAKGLAAISDCYRLASAEPHCQYGEAQLLSARADWDRRRGRPFLADLEQASRLSKLALAQLPDEQDALLARAEIALQLATELLQRAERPLVQVQEGLDAIDRALAGAPGLPRALAIRGALLLVRAKLEPDRDPQRVALLTARTALEAAFAGNPLLKRRYEGSWKEIARRLQGL